MHIIIYFCGTRSNDAHRFISGYDYVSKDDHNIQTLFIRGCDEPDVCGSALVPNLKKYAAKFCRRLFKTGGDADKPTLHFSQRDLAALRIGVNDTILTKTKNKDNPNTLDLTYHGDIFKVKNVDDDARIESITLCGFSRGAVTCFEVAKQLNILAPHIPVDIIANQPVPGNSKEGPGTNSASIADCRKLTNLRSVTFILGAYTGEKISKKTNKVSTSSMHRLFFSQIIPRLAATVHRCIVFIPKLNHRTRRVGTPSGHEHLHMHLAKHLSRRGLIEHAHYERKKEIARATYEGELAKFPPASQLQPIFGISEGEVYNHIDELYPGEKVWRGYEFLDKESLINWWSRQDKKASCFSSDLTKELVKLINETDENNMESIAKLFKQCDVWLILKNNSKTSRYHQVEALRNHLYHHLISTAPDRKNDILKIHHDNINSLNYYSRNWDAKSRAASFFKTKETHALDEAFNVYSHSKHTTDDNDHLIASLNHWLEIKKPKTTSKRYSLVLKIRDELKTLKEQQESAAITIPLLGN